VKLLFKLTHTNISYILSAHSKIGLIFQLCHSTDWFNAAEYEKQAPLNLVSLPRPVKMLK
jgi:hypothetical protein